MAEFRGFPACECQVAWLPEYERAAQLRGLIPGALHLFQLIGGNRKSGGTHVEGGAQDYLYRPGLVALAREMGADATWRRPFDWDGDGGIEHIHGVLRGCPHNGPARYQIDAVDAGFNGLGSGGRGAPDDGPRPLSGRTWREGIAWAQQQEALMVTEEDERKIEAIVGRVVTEKLDTFALAFGANVKIDHDGDPKTAKWSFDRIVRWLKR